MRVNESGAPGPQAPPKALPTRALAARGRLYQGRSDHPRRSELHIALPPLHGQTDAAVQP
ncbi:MAG: hypothetical protein ACRD1C_05840 [Terriglobales bacterium]